jgi:hypothetical protein
MDLILLEVFVSQTSLTGSYTLTDYEKIVLLLEDRRYFLHNGVDIWCIPRGLRRLVGLGRIGGVSTIEQQLVRTVLGFRERTLRRKAQEVALAMALSYRADKTDLLRAYLSMAYHGYGMTGCERASQFLFRKPAVELNRSQGALLASLLVYPLPKPLLESKGVKKLLPITSFTDFFAASGREAPKWTRNVKARSEYGLALLRKAEQPK